MKIIHLTHPYRADEIVNQDVVLALGFFDGVHLGHQAVIQAGRQVADDSGRPLALMTFNQHPKLIFTQVKGDDLKYLTPFTRKCELLNELGVDILYLIDFTYSFGAQSPQEFVDDYIVGLHAKTVVAGFDYTYGKATEANMQTLPQHARGRFDIIEIPQLQIDQNKVGTTSIRQAIKQGRIEEANHQLGYIYQTSGCVVHGFKRGRELGYPTTNIDTPSQELLPGVGVYVVSIWVQGRWYQGMASVGYNITFGQTNQLTCEVYILNFDQMIYGEQVKVQWRHFLRSEQKFDSIEALINQLDQDLVDTKAYFSNQKGESRC
ncbi:riboflavin biosynthesis protein RibF [Vaginisenegalia massiliensis]|uniref:riboflavin biosynthesis protein RibF n=1 Tax=Vaginisenegalia massiliensis TaxID=2058294 RepID=UPI000F539A94|nr:riboflavin biosynthesis protein RibF [Vaginisenegalia massiliensis]